MKTAAVGQGFSPFFWSPGLGICMLMPGVSPRGGGGGGQKAAIGAAGIDEKKDNRKFGFPII